jgi:hypothetical protein
MFCAVSVAAKAGATPATERASAQAAPNNTPRRLISWFAMVLLVMYRSCGSLESWINA